MTWNYSSHFIVYGGFCASETQEGPIERFWFKVSMWFPLAWRYILFCPWFNNHYSQWVHKKCFWNSYLYIHRGSNGWSWRIIGLVYGFRHFWGRPIHTTLIDHLVRMLRTRVYRSQPGGDCVVNQNNSWPPKGGSNNPAPNSCYYGIMCYQIFQYRKAKNPDF